MKRLARAAALLLALSGPTAAFAQDAGAHSSDAELAHQLSNPVASLISVPLQLNYDCCWGGEDEGRSVLNIQPVIPFKLSPNWNLIVRTILPLVDDNYTSQQGVGDTLQSFFFSPQAHNGFTWALGPAISYPTGTDDLSSGKWGLGPTALALKQHGHTTYGVLANHIWSIGGSDNHPDVSQTFIQPFFNYTFADSTGISVNSETTYDWVHEQWTIPINVGVTHMYKFGTQRVQLGLTGRAYLDAPDGGPDWGLRFTTTFLFPEG